MGKCQSKVEWSDSICHSSLYFLWVNDKLGGGGAGVAPHGTIQGYIWPKIIFIFFLYLLGYWTMHLKAHPQIYLVMFLKEYIYICFKIAFCGHN